MSVAIRCGKAEKPEKAFSETIHKCKAFAKFQFNCSQDVS